MANLNSLVHSPTATAGITSTGELEIELSSVGKDAIARGCSDIRFPEAGENAYITLLRAMSFDALGPEICGLLDAVRAGTLTPVAVIVRNLPHEEVRWSPRPGEAAITAKRSDLSENIAVMLTAALGEPYGVLSEGARLVNDLIPSRSDQGRLTGNGSRKSLGFHVENAALRWLLPPRDLSPSWLVLSGVSEQVSGGPLTVYAGGRRAAALVSENHRGQLARPCVRIAVPERWRERMGLSALRTHAVPILAGPSGREIVTAAFYGDMMEPLDADAAEAIAAFEEAIDRVATGVSVAPGTAVALPNAHTLHGRQSFEPAIDDLGRSQRWVQRVFATGRLDHFDIGRRVTERVFDPLA